MSLKDLIAAAFNKDASSFESAFSAVMQEKVSAGIQSRFAPVAEEVGLEEATECDDEEEEDEDELDEGFAVVESDQIDELSNDTLRSYTKKAKKQYEVSHDARNSAQKADTRKKHAERYAKRHKGIGSVIKRDMATQHKNTGTYFEPKAFRGHRGYAGASMTDKTPQQLHHLAKEETEE